MNKKVRVLIAWVSGALVVVLLAGWGWHVHEESLQGNRARAEIGNLPTAADYGNGHAALVYRGQADGFQVKLVEWVSPQSKEGVEAQSAGSCVVTYVGSHPPQVSFVQIAGDVPHMVNDILGQGFNASVYPARISPNHYLYWITHWNTRSPFNTALTRQEYATSFIAIQLASGRSIKIHPRKATGQSG